MSRLYSAGTWLFSSLSIALSLLVPLAVPEGALADSGGSCFSSCETSCNELCGSDQTCYEECLGSCLEPCCVSSCNGDPSCQLFCCQENCEGDQDCISECQGKGGCAGDNCSIPNNPCNPLWWPNCPNTITNCNNSAPPKRDCSGCICRDVGAGLDKCGCRLKP